LLGKDIGSTEGREFSERVLDFMRDRLIEYQKETGNNYNLEATPAEGTSYRLAKIDKKMNKKIIVQMKKHTKKVQSLFTLILLNYL